MSLLLTGRNIERNPEPVQQGHNYLKLCTEKGVRICHLNICSLINKVDEIRVFCETHKPHLLCLNETWLDTSIADGEIQKLSVQNLKQIICDYTCVTQHSKTLIDLFLTSRPDVYITGVLPQNFKCYNQIFFLEDLNKVPWSQIDIIGDVENSWASFTKYYPFNDEKEKRNITITINFTRMNQTEKELGKI